MAQKIRETNYSRHRDQHCAYGTSIIAPPFRLLADREMARRCQSQPPIFAAGCATYFLKMQSKAKESKAQHGETKERKRNRMKGKENNKEGKENIHPPIPAGTPRRAENVQRAKAIVGCPSARQERPSKEYSVDASDGGICLRP